MPLIVRPLSWAKEIGERIRGARERLGLSRAALGDLIESHEKSVGNYERGDHVPWEKLPVIAEVLDVDLRWLLHGHGFEDPLVEIQTKLQELQARQLELVSTLSGATTERQEMMEILRLLRLGAQATERSLGELEETMRALDREMADLRSGHTASAPAARTRDRRGKAPK